MGPSLATPIQLNDSESADLTPNSEPMPNIHPLPSVLFFSLFLPSEFTYLSSALKVRFVNIVNLFPTLVDDP